MDKIQYLLERLEAMDKKYDDKLDAILIQTTKTNGRVNALEDWKKNVAKVVSVIVGFGVTVAGYFFEKEINK